MLAGQAFRHLRLLMALGGQLVEHESAVGGNRWPCSIAPCKRSPLSTELVQHVVLNFLGEWVKSTATNCREGFYANGVMSGRMGVERFGSDCVLAKQSIRTWQDLPRVTNERVEQ